MKKREIRIPRGYDTKTQSRIGLFAAQLDDQLKLLKTAVGDLTVEQLEWQYRPGMNTVGMLLAHIAVAEVWWLRVAHYGLPWEGDGEKIIKKICGFEDDGLPLPEDGRHPEMLKGMTVKQYLDVLSKARRGSHRELKNWKDRDLDKIYTSYYKRQISYAWTLYHVLEHFAGHFGQILMLKHMMRDAGVLVEPDKRLK